MMRIFGLTMPLIGERDAAPYDDSACPRTMRRGLRPLDNCLPGPGFGQQVDAGFGARRNGPYQLGSENETRTNRCFMAGTHQHRLQL